MARARRIGHLGIVLITAAGCSDPMDARAVLREPFPFEGPAHHVRGASEIDALAVATAALQPGETLAWSGPIELDGIGGAVVTAAAEDGDGVARGFAVLPDGSVMPTEELRDREYARIHDRFGKLHPELYGQQAALGDDDELRVAVMVTGDWVEYAPPYPGTDVQVSGDDLRAYVAWHRAAQRERIAAGKQPLRQLLAEAGLEEGPDLASIPMVVFSAPAWFLRSQALNEMDAVTGVFESRDETASQLLGYAGHGSMNEGAFTGGGCGGDCDGGAGVFDVGIWERTDEDFAGTSYGTVANYHPRYWAGMNVNLKVPATSCSDPYDCGQEGQICYAGYCRQEHVSDVVASVGIVGNYVYGGTGSPVDGTPNAPGGVTFPSSGAWAIDVAVANQLTGDAEVENVNWLLDEHQGLYINRSTSGLTTAAARLTDWAARTDGTMFTFANGNDVNIDSCSNVWNGLCVGWYAYNTYNSSSTHRRFIGAHNGDYVVGSTYKNSAASPLFERPHLLGPGGHLDIISGSGGYSGLHMPDIENTSNSMMTRFHLDNSGEIYGSSFSAPQVLGAAITAAQYEGYFSAFAFPVMNKAALLAATVDSNADGSIGNSNVWSHGSGIDYEDGAGHVKYDLLKVILDYNRYAYLQLTNGSFVSCGASCREYTVATVTVHNTARIKVAMAFNACTNGSVSPFVNNDLDLYVVRPASCGGALQSNAGLTSEIEMVRETSCAPYPSGQWTIKVRIKNGATLATCYGDATEKIGVAWSLQSTL